MSLQLFQRAVRCMHLKENDREWFPKWMDGYSRHHQQPANLQEHERMAFSRELVIGFLQSLRDRQVPAWRRLQAALAMEAYQQLVLRQDVVDFAPIRSKLQELAQIERRCGGPLDLVDSTLVPGEGNAGKIDANEPEAVRRMQAQMRLVHAPKSTEETYVGWLRRFIRHVDNEQLDAYGVTEIAEFLSELALDRNVSGGTQNQALSAILYYYQKVLGREIGFISSVRARVSTYRPWGRGEECGVRED